MCSLAFSSLSIQHDAQMDHYARRLATCSSDRSVKIFDVTDGNQTLVADLRGFVRLLIILCLLLRFICCLSVLYDPH